MAGGGGGGGGCGGWWCWLGVGVSCCLFLRFGGYEEVGAENGARGVVSCSFLGVDVVSAEDSSVRGGHGVDDDGCGALVDCWVVLVRGASSKACQGTGAEGG